MVNFRLDLKRFQSSNSTNGKKERDLKMVTNPELTTDSTLTKDNLMDSTSVIFNEASETKEKGKDEAASENLGNNGINENNVKGVNNVKAVNNEKDENNEKDVNNVNNENNENFVNNGEVVKEKGVNYKGERKNNNGGKWKDWETMIEYSVSGWEEEEKEKGDIIKGESGNDSEGVEKAKMGVFLSEEEEKESEYGKKKGESEKGNEEGESGNDCKKEESENGNEEEESEKGNEEGESGKNNKKGESGKNNEEGVNGNEEGESGNDNEEEGDGNEEGGSGNDNEEGEKARIEFFLSEEEEEDEEEKRERERREREQKERDLDMAKEWQRIDTARYEKSIIRDYPYLHRAFSPTVLWRRPMEDVVNTEAHNRAKKETIERLYETKARSMHGFLTYISLKPGMVYFMPKPKKEVLDNLTKKLIILKGEVEELAKQIKKTQDGEGIPTYEFWAHPVVVQERRLEKLEKIIRGLPYYTHPVDGEVLMLCLQHVQGKKAASGQLLKWEHRLKSHLKGRKIIRGENNKNTGEEIIKEVERVDIWEEHLYSDPLTVGRLIGTFNIRRPWSVAGFSCSTLEEALEIVKGMPEHNMYMIFVSEGHIYDLAPQKEGEKLRFGLRNISEGVILKKNKILKYFPGGELLMAVNSGVAQKKITELNGELDNPLFKNNKRVMKTPIYKPKEGAKTRKKSPKSAMIYLEVELDPALDELRKKGELGLVQMYRDVINKSQALKEKKNLVKITYQEVKDMHYLEEKRELAKKLRISKEEKGEEQIKVNPYEIDINDIIEEELTKEEIEQNQKEYRKEMLAKVDIALNKLLDANILLKIKLDLFKDVLPQELDNWLGEKMKHGPDTYAKIKQIWQIRNELWGKVMYTKGNLEILEKEYKERERTKEEKGKQEEELKDISEVMELIEKLGLLKEKK